MFVHRRLTDGDIYFLSNRTERPLSTYGVFRVAGRLPELWHADTGATDRVSYRTESGRTIVPLRLEPNESVFVVFRELATAPSAAVPERRETRLTTLEGKWDVAFPPDLGAPATITLDHLGSWSDNPDSGVKYFSGTATYRKSIDVPGGWIGDGRTIVLHLGEVRELAEVFVNGRSLGIAWHPPYDVDITGALTSGLNTLEIKVTNLWVNRLIGDRQPGATKYTFTVSPTYKPDAPLRPSGLVGPVTLSRAN